MIVLADRNVAARDLLGAVADTGADLLVRVKFGRHVPACRRLQETGVVTPLDLPPAQTRWIWVSAATGS
jgi:hypothetical protein